MNDAPSPVPFAEDVWAEVELRGHFIDSLVLPKILDKITTLGGRFLVRKIDVGQQQSDESFAAISVGAPNAERLEAILVAIGQHGAVAVDQEDCRLVPVDVDGVLPEGFYCTTNETTEVRVGGAWLPVELQEMDCGLVVDLTYKRAHCIPMAEAVVGQLVVVGRLGTRVRVAPRTRQGETAFGFMNSTVSSEKPKGIVVRDIAAEMRATRAGRGRTLIVAGPAVVHTGSRGLLSELIRQGYVSCLFAGNALATHDIEQSLFGTSLGVSMTEGHSLHEGHEHHLRAINTVRRQGSIANAVASGVLSDGIMYECIKQKVPFLLAGSIRDDGPLPDVITDTVEAQRTMRSMIGEVTFCLMIATTLHSIAVGNLLPASVKVVCVDINPATVTKLADRGTTQTVGLVTDVEPFLRALVSELRQEPGGTP